MLVVDAANVVGSRPDGWWRDRAGAADRLLARIETAVEEGRLDAPVLVVLEGRARTANAPQSMAGGRLEVVRAAGSGDDRIVELASEAEGAGTPVTVVTADRALIARVREHGATVDAPSGFLGRL